jgi:hypothetical protein
MPQLMSQILRGAFRAGMKKMWTPLRCGVIDFERGVGHVSTTGSQLFTTIFL